METVCHDHARQPDHGPGRRHAGTHADLDLRLEHGCHHVGRCGGAPGRSGMETAAGPRPAGLPPLRDPGSHRARCRKFDGRNGRGRRNRAHHAEADAGWRAPQGHPQRLACGGLDQGAGRLPDLEMDCREYGDRPAPRAFCQGGGGGWRPRAGRGHRQRQLDTSDARHEDQCRYRRHPAVLPGCGARGPRAVRTVRGAEDAVPAGTAADRRRPRPLCEMAGEPDHQHARPRTLWRSADAGLSRGCPHPRGRQQARHGPL